MEEKSPVLAVAVASFDLLNGIKVIHKWIPNSNELGLSLDDLFRMTLSNVHRQKEEVFSNIVTSTMDIQSFGLFMISSLFSITKRPHSVYYSVSIILHSTDRVRNTSEIYNEKSRYLALAAKSIVSANEPIKKLSPLVDQLFTDSTIINNSSIKNIPDIYMHPSESNFLCLVLSSHLQTQMNSIIEAPNEDMAREIFNFLVSFTLPFQRSLSSGSINSKPVPGLALQVIEKQSYPPEELGLLFRSPFSLIRLPEKTILQTPASNDQENAYNEYAQVICFDSSIKKKRLAQIRTQYKLTPVQLPTPWSLATVSVINQIPTGLQNYICEQQLNSLVRFALALISMVEEKLNSSDSTFLSTDQQNELIKTLRLTGKDDFALVVSVAQLFDKTMQNKVFFRKKEVFAKIASAY